MAYYLGYKKDEEFQPIDIQINDAHNILSIVNFTCSFENEEELIEHLLYEGLITDEKIQLSYLIDKGKKGNKTYMDLPNIKRIFYYGNSSFFNVDKLKFYIKSSIKNKTLVIFLLSNILKKYGISDNLRRFLNDNTIDQNRREYLISVLNAMLRNSSLSSFGYRIQNLIKCIQNDTSVLDTEINIFVDFVLSNNDAVVYIYRTLKRQLNIPYFLALDDLLSLERLIDCKLYDERGIDSLIDKFISHFVYQGKNINPRNLVDLGSMIIDYKEYELDIEMQRFESTTRYDIEYDDEDEFLEEADFERCDTTSESAGIRLRPTDFSTWEKGN